MHESDLPLATDKECKELRELLIKRGVIKILTEEEDNELVKQNCKKLRGRLIKAGLITPA